MSSEKERDTHLGAMSSSLAVTYDNKRDPESFATEIDTDSPPPTIAFPLSRKRLLIFYFWIYVFFILSSLQIHITSNVAIYVTSSFNKAPLITTAEVLSWLIAGVVKLPLAKLMDTAGRPAGFSIVAASATIGLALMASCTKVETFAAGQVFYWLGWNSCLYILDVFMADTSSLSWRGLLFGLLQTPILYTTFMGPPAAQSLVDSSTWRWGYGAFAILVPLVAIPVMWMLIIQHREKKLKLKNVSKENEAPKGSWARIFQYYIIQFDLLGVILICAGATLVLLPLTLATYQTSKWKSAAILVMLVVGVCCLVVFGFYERFFAVKPFLPYNLLIDRTVIGSCLMIGAMQCSISCWDQYLRAYLQVVFDLNITNAGYVSSIHQLGAIIWSILVGILIRYTGQIKWLAVFGVLCQILGTGLMIYLRQASQGIGKFIICQIIVAFASGTLTICSQLAVMAAVGTDLIAVGLSVHSLFVSFGGAVGTSVSGAIWTNTLLPGLEEHLPGNVARAVYSNLPAALKYPVGSLERTMIIEAYTASQRYMCIASTSILSFCIFSALVWRNWNTKELDKGR